MGRILIGGLNGIKVVLLSWVLSACSSVTIKPEFGLLLHSEPDFEKSMDFFVFGVIGENRIDVSEICGVKQPVQMKTEQTFRDGVLMIISVGVYAPHTAKVWCK